MDGDYPINILSDLMHPSQELIEHNKRAALFHRSRVDEDLHLHHPRHPTIVPRGHSGRVRLVLWQCSGMYFTFSVRKRELSNAPLEWPGRPRSFLAGFSAVTSAPVPFN
jgi:hypothetical protein